MQHRCIVSPEPFLLVPKTASFCNRLTEFIVNPSRRGETVLANQAFSGSTKYRESTKKLSCA